MLPRGTAWRYSARCAASRIEHRGDIVDFGRVRALLVGDRRALIVASEVVSWIVDPCSRNRTRGSFGMFDEFANNIVAAGVVVAFL